MSNENQKKDVVAENVTESATTEQVREASNLPPVKSPTEFLDKSKIELETRLQLRQEYENLFKIWKANDFADLEKKQDEIIAKGLKEYFVKWQEEQKPPVPEDIQKLLDQEYETFTLKLQWVNGEAEETQMFTIRELPQSVERKFYMLLRDKLIDKLSLLEAFTQSGIDKPFEEKARSGLELFDESFDILADGVKLCLDPFGRKPTITREWVQDHVSSDRQWSIVQAQMKVNRLRDFFSKVSTSGRDMMMTTRPNFQALQTLAA